MRFGKRRGASERPFRRGDVIEVRSESEILATLDSHGKLEGLPFMPEMARYFGRRFRVHRRAERVFLDHHYYVAGMEGTVLLEHVRCDGGSHGGCKMGCLLFWKEAWLKAAQSVETGQDASLEGHSSDNYALPVRQGGRFCCQATELTEATSRLPWWDIRQYVRDLVSGNVTAGQLARMVLLLAYNKLRGTCGLGRHAMVSGRQITSSPGRLNLKPGEMVEVKSKEEIEATLDERGRTGGLGFASEMLDSCGGRYRVADRVERVILEWSGQMRPINDTVILEGVTCNGVSRRGCPRDCYQLWRESWLKRVT